MEKFFNVKKIKEFEEDPNLGNLVKAILAINTTYFKYKNDDSKAGHSNNVEQRERIFAYELYHQWSMVKPTELILNGELGKYIENRYIFPDMALHGGQDDYDHNEIVVEIKRVSQIDNGKDGLVKDWKKLSLYLKNDKPGNKSKFRRYKHAVSIIYGADYEKIKSFIINNQESFTEINKDIIIIATPESGVLYYFTLEKILETINH